MVSEQFFNEHKRLIAYNHIHMISENRPMPNKAQKDLWIKLWSMKKRKARFNYFKRLYRKPDLQMMALYITSFN